MATRFERNPTTSSHGRRPSTESRMYLLHVQRTATEYIAAHLRGKKFPVTVSAWIPGQLYVVSDSPKTIAHSLPSSLYLAVKEYIRITDEERKAVGLSQSKLPAPSWVRITKGKYKGDIGRVSNSKEDFVKVFVATRDFPYQMPRGSRALLERSRLPNTKAVSDIIQDGEVVGLTYKGEKLLASPHVDDIQLHLESGWDMPFLKNTVVAFSLQFLRVGDYARVVRGSLHGDLGKVVSTNHAHGSVGLELTFNGCLEEIEVLLQDIERMF
ncbi:hypothetical protein DEU56DRAFT_915790 [Suillus clintonianus]|uniref:uncharacterized protein n=1 Tax=Suillus clintonianus TaxID=1904413 RepID=UPI001B86ECCA|nr:uncharacterized protein DEU56DRAFT_915790 [Suillus clintonianus]KAG2127247.1 hypothetical protein DEU56DRAFT_915790 [Suillus clintonianus]